MNSGGSSSDKAVKTPQPQGSQITPYGNSTPFSPQYTNFLPDSVGADGRMPMATGLDEGMLSSIRDRPPPPELMGGGGNEMAMKAMLAKLMAEKSGYQIPGSQRTGPLMGNWLTEGKYADSQGASDVQKQQIRRRALGGTGGIGR
jgi:hypothetical protein